MPLEAKLITAAQWGATAPYLIDGPEGWRGYRAYQVNTHDEYQALSAVPIKGTPWSPTLPNLVIVNRRGEYIAKRDVEGTEPPTGGLTVVHLDYQEPPGGGTAVPSEPGTKYTELAYGTETQTVHFALNPVLPTPNPVPPLANGEGAAVKYGVISAKVHVFIPRNSTPDLARLSRLTRFKNLNEDSITLPKIWGTNVTWNLGPGQAQYEGFVGPTARGNALEIIHELSLAPDFLFRWQIEDENGFGVELVESELYHPASFGGLW